MVSQTATPTDGSPPPITPGGTYTIQVSYSLSKFLMTKPLNRQSLWAVRSTFVAQARRATSRND